MKNLIVLLVILAVCIAGFGFYRGWFTAETGSSGSKSNVSVSVDKDKVKSDIDSLKPTEKKPD